MVLKTIQFLAVVLTALALVSSAAHLSALPNQTRVLQDTYYVFQRSYVAWPQIGALIANAALAVLVRSQPVPFWLAIVGFVTIAAAQVIFFLWIYPANQLTADDWKHSGSPTGGANGNTATPRTRS